MRQTLIVLALLLGLTAACTPAPPSSQPAAEPSAAQCTHPETLSAAEAAQCAANGAATASNTEAPGAAPPPAFAANNSAALSATPASGNWVFHGDEGVTSTCFGPPQSECAIAFQCEAPTGKLSVLYSAELIPDQPTTLTILTPTQTLPLPARSFNEGLPSINAELADESAEKAALIALLYPTQQSFAVDAHGEISVYPWNEAIARTLNACR